MELSHGRSPRHRCLLVVVLTVLALFVPTAAQAAAPQLTVMTRNLYLGADLTATIAAPTLAQRIAADTEAWQDVLASDFRTRARALAAEIDQVRPDVVGLQEVTLWREQRPSDIAAMGPNGPAQIGSSAPNARHVVLDFLSILQEALAARGLPYTAVVAVVNTDAEGPVQEQSGLIDVRFTDRDVILVRTSLVPQVSDSTGANYNARLTLPTVIGPVTFVRGWTSIDYDAAPGTTVRILNTHLEVASQPFAPLQVAQGKEFVALVAASPHPVLAVGDFNSRADGGDTPTYANLTAVLHDAWPAAGPSNSGLTCCQAELLDNRTRREDRRIDLVLASEDWPVSQVLRTGEFPFRPAPAPLWASDHFGVAARYTIG
ncbi:endonuclease/exonuclease/phosphatase family protein [Geodermatophilus sp. SYSU D00815]